MIYQTKPKPLFAVRMEDFEFVPHAHREMEIFICVNGTCGASCNFQQRILRRGDVMIAFPNDIHAYSRTQKGTCVILTADPFLLGGFGEFGGTQYENFLLSGDDRFISLALALCEEAEGDGNTEVMLGYVHVILGEVMKRLPVSDRSAPVIPTQFSAVLKYLSENYTKRLSLQGISKQFGISAAHLSRVFQKRLSCPFMKYLHTLRVEHAKHLLAHSQMCILEIVYESGFSDQRTFNRVFKELTGAAPSEYRRRSQS